MAYNSINGYNTTRVTGLASGMDTDSLVKQLVQSEQSNIDRIYKQNTKLEWKKDLYSGINSQLKDFRNKFMSATSADNVFAPSVYRTYKVNMEASKLIEVKGTALAQAGSHKIEGFKMADSAKAEGLKHRNRVVKATSGTSGANLKAVYNGTKQLNSNQGATKLSDLTFKDGTNVFTFPTGDKNLKFSINGKEVSVDADTTLDELVKKVNDETNAKMTVTADGNVLLESKETGKDAQLTLKNINNRIFGQNGLFGIDITEGTTIKATSQINTGMTFKEIAAITGKDYGFDDKGSLSFKINGQTFNIKETDKLSDVMAKINKDAAANVTMKYDDTTDTFSIQSNLQNSSAKVKLENVTGKAFGKDGIFGIEAGTTTTFQAIDRNSDTIKSAAEKMGIDLNTDSSGKFSFTLKSKNSSGEVVSKTFSFSTDTTLQKMIDAVNSDTTVNVKMGYSQITDSFTFTSGNTGADAFFEVENNGGVNAFGGADSLFGIGAGQFKGTDAVLMIDGERIEKSTNSFVVDGLEFTLKSDFNAVVAENGEVTFGTADKPLDFSVSHDVDGIVEKVKTFVDEYNKVVKYLNDLISEEVDLDYEPLTEEERKALSEEELDKWDTAAKKGVMRNDGQIARLLSDMRSALYEKVGDTGLSPADIGLSTGNWQNKGQISFNEEKFRKALAENSDKVGQVMAATSESKDDKKVYQESGIITRFFDRMTSYESDITKVTLKNTNQSISDNEDRMQDLLKKMYEMEESYYLKFSQMETLLSKYQSQSTWLSQQLGSLG